MCGGLCDARSTVAVVDRIRYLPTPPAFNAADQRVAAKQIEIVTMAD